MRGQNQSTSKQLSYNQKIKDQVRAASERIAKLGNWPEHIDRQGLSERVPVGQKTASGFDAGVACALDMIPRHRQRLAACLHAAYTPDSVQQVLNECQEMSPDSETCWWLAACHVCQEGQRNEEEFRYQLQSFRNFQANPWMRKKAAENELAAMRSRYRLEAGVPFAFEDGGMQGAYLDGHQLATMHIPEDDLYFIGTFQPSLGLEEFSFSDEVDQQGHSRSGPVHGSKQFVRCHNQEELQSALTIVKRYLLC